MIFSRILTRSNSVSMIASKFRSHEREIHNELHANQLQVSSQSPLDGGGSKNSISNLNRFSHGRYDAKNEINPLVSSAKTLPTGHPYPHLKARVLVPVSDPNQHHYQNLKSAKIETTHTGDLGARGVMFDIRTKTEQPVQIRSLTFHAKNATELCAVRVFTKHGSHRSFELNSTAWTMIVDTDINCTQKNTVITFSMFDLSLRDELIIEGNSVRTVYIDIDNFLKYSRISSMDAVFVEDSYLQILEGTALSKFYDGTYNPIMWNGVLAYRLEERKSPTELPHLDFLGRERNLSTSTSPTEHPQLEVLGCEGNLSTSSNDATASYGHMFNIGSNYPGGVIIDGLEFHTKETTMVDYKIYTIATRFQDSIGNLDDWTLVASGNITGAGTGAGTRIAGSDFVATTIEMRTTRGFYITLGTEKLSYTESCGLNMGEIFIKNKHVSIEVGAGVAEYPMGDKFFSPRQWNGRVLYRTTVECPVPTSVVYKYNVQYPKDLHGDVLIEEFRDTVKRFLTNFLTTDSKVKSLEEESGNGITLLSTTIVNNSGSLSSCKITPDLYLCDTLKITVKIGYLSTSDTGYIHILLLQQYKSLSDAVNRVFIAKYVGYEPTVARVRLILTGVKSSTMGLGESAYLEEVLKYFLNRNIILSSVKVLTVEVIKIAIQPSRLLMDNRQFIEHSCVSKNSSVTTNRRYTVMLQIIIKGIYHPPPEITFETIVKDTINFKTAALKDELAADSADKGAVYFRCVEKVAAQTDLRDLISNMPSPTSTHVPSYGAYNTGGALGSIVVVAIIAAVVLGCYIVYNCIYDEDRVKKGVEEKNPKLFVKPRLDGCFKNRQDIVSSKKTVTWQL